MRYLILSLLFALAVARPVAAQDNQPDTTVVRPMAAQDVQPDTTVAPPPPAWKHDVVGRLATTQVGYRNWTEGGVNTLAATAQFEATSTGLTPNWEQTHELRLGFGIVKQDTLTVRKAEDIIRIRTSLQYRGEGFFRTLNPTVAAELNTQFAAGFNFKKNPFEDGRRPPVKVSDFFAPATFAQSIGLTYAPRTWFRQRIGIGLKQTVVMIERFRPLYNLRADQAVRVEAGLESRTRFEKEVFQNVLYKSSLGFFAAFNQPNVPDLLWENVVAMKVNSWLGVNFELTTLFDRDLSRALQFKESLSLALSIKFV